jgi:hypothetical protein
MPDGLPESAAIGAAGFRAVERIDEDAGTLEIRNFAQHVIRQDAKVRAHAAEKVAENSTVQQTKRMVRHSNHSAARRDLLQVCGAYLNVDV